MVVQYCIPKGENPRTARTRPFVNTCDYLRSDLLLISDAKKEEMLHDVQSLHTNLVAVELQGRYITVDRLRPKGIYVGQSYPVQVGVLSRVFVQVEPGSIKALSKEDFSTEYEVVLPSYSNREDRIQKCVHSKSGKKYDVIKCSAYTTDKGEHDYLRLSHDLKNLVPDYMTCSTEGNFATLRNKNPKGSVVVLNEPTTKYVLRNDHEDSIKIMGSTSFYIEYTILEEKETTMPIRTCRERGYDTPYRYINCSDYKREDGTTDTSLLMHDLKDLLPDYMEMSTIGNTVMLNNTTTEEDGAILGTRRSSHVVMGSGTAFTVLGDTAFQTNYIEMEDDEIADLEVEDDETNFSGTVGEENSGLPYALQDNETGRIAIAQQTNAETQESRILFWLSDSMIQEAASKIPSAQ